MAVDQGALIVGLLVLACLCTGAETGLIFLDRNALRRLAEEGHARAASALSLLARAERVRMALIVGSHLSFAAATAVFCAVSVKGGAPTIRTLCRLLVFAASAFTLQFLCKWFFRRRGESAMLALAWWIKIWALVIWPVSWILGRAATHLGGTLDLAE